MSGLVPAFAEFLHLIVLSQWFRSLISAVFGGAVSAMVSVLMGFYLNHRLNHIQRIAEVTHAVAADTNQIVNDNTTNGNGNGNGGKH